MNLDLPGGITNAKHRDRGHCHLPDAGTHEEAACLLETLADTLAALDPQAQILVDGEPTCLPSLAGLAALAAIGFPPHAITVYCRHSATVRHLSKLLRAPRLPFGVVAGHGGIKMLVVTWS